MFSLAATLIMTGIATATSIAAGVAKKKSGERTVDSQERIAAEQDKFNQESRDMQRARKAELLSFNKQMAGQQQKRDKITMQAQEEDLKSLQGRQQAGMRESILDQKRTAPQDRMNRLNKNILNIGGK